MLDYRILQFINLSQEILSKSNNVRININTFKLNEPSINSKEAVESFSNGLSTLYKQINEDIGEDWTNLTLETAESLGFMRWASDDDIDKDIEEIKNNYNENNNVLSYINGSTMEEKIANIESTRYLWLIPAYILALVPEGIHLTSISGQEIIYETCEEYTSMIKDFRLGVSSWGITFSKEEVEAYYKSNKELAELNLD